MGQAFSTSVKVISFALYLWLTGSLIGFFLMIEVSEVFFFHIIARGTKSIWCYT